VPNYLIAAVLGLTDNPWGVIWPAVATPTGVFLLRQYMLTLPEFVVLRRPVGLRQVTLLRMIAGLEDITDGEIMIGGDVVNDVAAASATSPWCSSPMRSIRT
jgi:hypothetical protein